MTMKMDIDPPHESDGSSSISKDNEIYLDSYNPCGQGLPYAPEDFPNPGDKWGWKVGKRVGVSGHFVDRYLYLPPHLQKQYKIGVFASKASVKRFVMGTFPKVDIDAFFASFTWKISNADVKGNKEFPSPHPNCISESDVAGCKAGNMMCPTLLETIEPPLLDVKACDICHNGPRFCCECCCILCFRPVNSRNGNHTTVIRCEAPVEDGLICGHIAHVRCGVRSYVAGTVGGRIGLEAEYFCRRCDFRTDLVPHVASLFESCESIPCAEKLEKTLNLCVLLLRGSVKPSAKTLLQQVQSALAKLKEGSSLEDVWKRDVASAVTTGEVCESETDAMEVSNFKEPSPQMCVASLDNGGGCVELEQTLAALRRAQEAEYSVAEDVLLSQRNYLLALYKELDKEKSRLAEKHSGESLVDTVLDRIDQIKRELAKLDAMEQVGKGLGRTSKTTLKRHFGVK